MRILSLITLVSVFCLSACNKKAIPVAQKKSNDSLYHKALITPPKKLVSLNLGSIKANDIQENLTFSDELILSYSISLIENEKIIQTYAAMKKLGTIKQGQKIQLDSLVLPSIKLTKNQKIGIQLALWEIDNYEEISKKLNQVNTFGGILQVPIALAEWSAISNPLGWFLWGTRAGGLGMIFLSKFDQNDLLGVSEIVWPFDEIPKGKVERFKRVNWKGGKSGINSYDYQFTYQIRALD